MLSLDIWELRKKNSLLENAPFSWSMTCLFVSIFFVQRSITHKLLQMGLTNFGSFGGNFGFSLKAVVVEIAGKVEKKIEKS
jgi:hypothetical protein